MRQDLLLFATSVLLIWLISAHFYAFVQRRRVVSLLYSLVMILLFWFTIQHQLLVGILVLIMVIQNMLRYSDDPSQLEYLFSRDMMFFRIQKPQTESVSAAVNTASVEDVFVPAYRPNRRKLYDVYLTVFIATTIIVSIVLLS